MFGAPDGEQPGHPHFFPLFEILEHLDQAQTALYLLYKLALKEKNIW